MIGPHFGWEIVVQDNGRQEMAHRLHYQGPAAAAAFAALFEKTANAWLACQGLQPSFQLEWIELPTVS